jgi:DNA-binding beta-propeller fold protein YncE
MNHWPTILLAVLLLVPAWRQAPPQQTATASVALPNPYRTIDRWGTLPAGRTWGGVTAVDIDRDGRSVWVLERCGTMSCADSTLAPILELDASGAVVASFGAGMFVVPHGLHVDHDGNIWATDASDGQPGNAGKGHQVFKFAPDGRVLMSLGKAGVAGAGTDVFNRPSDVVVAPNGDVFVADGHGGATNNRIVKFSREGRYLTSWGRKGSGPGEFDLPHSLAMDSQGRLFVADLNNFRVQAFTQDGTFLFEWKQFGMPGGLFIDRHDTLYVADSLSGSDRHPGWARGIRIGSALDGKLTAFIPDRTPQAEPITAAEAVAVDAAGTVYGAVVPAQMLQKHVRQ